MVYLRGRKGENKREREERRTCTGGGRTKRENTKERNW